MTHEQINKAAEEYADNADELRGFKAGAVLANHNSRQEIEELKAENAKLREENSVALSIIADNGLSSFLKK